MDSHESYTIPYDDFNDILQIGCAGSGTVIHKALWKSQNNRQVAIKIYNKQLHDKEVNILRKLDHPNIIKFYGIVNPPFSSGIVIEYASGGDLLNFLASKREQKIVRLPRRQFTHWCLDIAVALQYLHGRHITHKDIKSPNVLLSDDIIHEKDEESLNRLKICDFGVSKELTSTESVVSRQGGCTKSWAAPEVITDDRVVSQKSDIYSLCVVFWEIWTCQQPWSDHLASEIETKVKGGTLLEIPTDFPDLMKPMILKCWKMERHKRCNIDDVIACIKHLMSEWQIKVWQENTSGNQGNAQCGVISEESVEEDKIMQQQTRLEDQKPDKVPVQKKQDVEQTFIETEWVDVASQNSKSHEITKTEVEEAKCFQSSEIVKQEACEEEEEYTTINEDDIDLDHGDNDVYYDITQEDYYHHVIPVFDEQSEPKDVRCPVVASKSDESMQRKEEDLENSAKQAVENASESNETGVFESGHVAYIVNRFESFDALDDNAVESLRREVSGIKRTVNNGREENPTTTGRSDVAPISPVLPVTTYQNLMSPVPKIADYYDDIDGTCVPPEGKSGEELTKLYEHVEKSYTDLKLVKEECIDNDRFNGILNGGELRHLMTNMNDVESIMSRFYTWFNKCRWQIPAICQLITNILEADYLQPIINFAIYSQLQMNMLNCIRYRHLHFAEKFTRLQRRGSEDIINYKLSFKDLQEIILKQANWLKKFHSILKSFCDALVVENVEDTSVIEDMKECCCKLHQIILNCTEHECRIIRDIQHHSTSILQKLRFKSVGEKERESQKAMVSEESWVKKMGTIYLTEDVKQSKRQSVIERRKKCTMMAFVSTVIIVEDKGEYLRVIDCVHKNDIKFERQVYQNMNYTGDETLMLTKMDPLTKLPVKEYGFTLEDSTEISLQEWTKAFEFSEEEKKSQDTEYVTPMNDGLLDTADTEPTYEDCYRTKYARMKSLYENLEAMQVLASIISLNKKTIESISKLIELYTDNVVLSSIIGEGEKHHLYLNVREVNDVIKSFNNCLETNQYDSFNLFTELRKHLDNDSFHPIIEYQAHLCFQRNMLQFQRKHPTVFSQALGNLERNTHAKWCVSQMDLQVRLSKPADWLTRLYHKLKSLEAAIIRDPDHQEIFHRLNADTLHMLHQLILRGQHLKEGVEQDYSKHVTSVLLKLPTETINEPHLIQKLSNIQDDWIQKHDSMVLFRKRKKDLVNQFKRRYHSTQINIIVSTSAIIFTSSSEVTVENLKTQRFCRCFDRNYADVGIIDAKSRESWMPEREHLFKLWIYEKEDVEYKQYEYVIGLNSDRSMEDLLEWKSALVVATGESGIFDDYRRPSHIVTESFITDREDELHLEIDDIVEVLKMEDARGKTWVKGMRLSDKKSGWFPSNKLGHEVDSEYNRGQAVKLRYQKEREREKESDDEKKKDTSVPKTVSKSRKSFVYN